MTSVMAARREQSVPRYTSYPTAPHFTPAVTADLYGKWIQELDPSRPLSLYLHVPFCQEMCWYCGCHTKVVARHDPVARYAAALRAEIALLADLLPGRFSISHIHWGGGTPTMLSAEDFSVIMNDLRLRFDITETAELAVEIDPRSIDAEKIVALAVAGINRASLGVQDFSPDVQQAINRLQSFELTKQVTDDLRAAGIDKINFDLMYGLPRQTERDILHTIDLAHSLGPDRMALFGYAHVPWMKSHMKMIREEELPDSDARYRQAQQATERLLDLGYRQIGLDHFARDDDAMVVALDAGRLKRNFQGYTVDDAAALIGIGASAIGRLPQGYIQNAVSVRSYAELVLAGRLPIARGIAMTEDDRLRAQVIERLMCDFEVDLQAIARSFERAIDYFAPEIAALAPFTEEGLLHFDGNRLKVLPEGRLLVRTICAVFDSYLAGGTAQHSKAV
ncbi:MAG: oxygen-independent coproporphyrinogen III oxidase [Sneathiella sp.]|uniref:oxygen-independent coproporphyrinogen III oxidase n=1 Tax=Sneathiella sp. TaxID=1964365 RepID=UPI000C6782B7|nr:oxygen-independent coproporphyrinogen III oxidase [Sneathiella sp.]MAL80316.1 oxygen-independent coproporphyrinogen III oxidase [Sneathiella sp.]